MRADLLALTDDSLAALANRGIVRRSLREVADGKGPTLSETEGTVTAAYADGTTVVLATSATLEQSRCTCPASGVCRHRVMLAVAYRATTETPAGDGVVVVAEPPETDGSWSPGSFTDDELGAHVGSRTFAVARKTFRTGYRARIRRPTDADHVPTVELAACTVRFLVPRQVGYARVDAAPGAREDAIALAVWAFRVADDADPDAAISDVEVGGTTAAVVAGGSGIEPVLPLLADLLADGVAGTGAEVATAVAQVRRTADARNLRWPVDLLDDLADQLDAYRARSSRYHPVQAAAYVAESIARHRCVSGGGASLRVEVLGTEETAETPLRLLRLTGLGARVRGDDASRTVEIYLAHPEAGVVLALRRRVDVDDGEPPSADELGRRKAGGARLSTLASANVVTESAVRSANRVVRIAESRLAKTSVARSAGRWDDLPEGILVTDLEAESARLAGLPPAMVRARVIAESVRAVTIEAVDDLRYLPGAQQLQATIQAPQGTARILFTHTAATPGAIDALAKALSGDDGPVRFVAGHLRRHGGGIDIEPSAVVAGSTVVVPAFAAAAAGQAISSTPATATDRLAVAVGEAIDISADLVHRGHRHVPPGWPQRANRSAQDLRQAGLSAAGASLDALAEVVRYGGVEIVDRWADAHLRLLVTAEQL